MHNVRFVPPAKIRIPQVAKISSGQLIKERGQKILELEAENQKLRDSSADCWKKKCELQGQLAVAMSRVQDLRHELECALANVEKEKGKAFELGIKLEVFEKLLSGATLA